MPKTSLCAGSFDPPTNGHINIIERGLKLFDKVIVAVAVNSSKKTTFTAPERVAMLQEIFKGRSGIEIDTFEDRLLVDYARFKKATILLRGLRNITDYEYECQMALANKKLAPEIETVFMMTESQFSHLSSSLLKEIVFLGGSANEMIPPLVEKALKKLKKGPK
ncbi:MAG: pantetheine-phosphate adenylyltransferase [Deltaproteobacteria bacterium]|nr:pantetheine-phosphate adenylyltransferase [Deltaproteobacteria bacterium]